MTKPLKDETRCDGNGTLTEWDDETGIVVAVSDCPGCPACRPCTNCKGTAAVPWPEADWANAQKACPRCKGTGIEPLPTPSEDADGNEGRCTCRGFSGAKGCPLHGIPTPSDRDDRRGDDGNETGWLDRSLIHARDAVEKRPNRLRPTHLRDCFLCGRGGHNVRQVKFRDGRTHSICFEDVAECARMWADRTSKSHPTPSDRDDRRGDEEGWPRYVAVRDLRDDNSGGDAVVEVIPASVADGLREELAEARARYERQEEAWQAYSTIMERDEARLESALNSLRGRVKEVATKAKRKSEQSIDPSGALEVLAADLTAALTPSPDKETRCKTCGSDDPLVPYEECDDGTYDPPGPFVNVNPCPDPFHTAPTALQGEEE